GSAGSCCRRETGRITRRSPKTPGTGWSSSGWSGWTMRPPLRWRENRLWRLRLEGDMVLVPTSPVFEDGGRIPNLYTCPGPNLSPPLTWDEVPGDVLSFALTCEDPDAPKGTFHHWAVYDIPAYA